MSEQDELLREFLVESYENLDRLDEEFVALEENPDATETLSSIFRTIHTIKGTCGFLELSRLESVTHAGENLLSSLRDGEVTVNDEVTTALLHLVDAVREMLAHIEETGSENDQEYGDLVKTLKDLQSAPDFGEHAPLEPGAAAELRAAEEGSSEEGIQQGETLAATGATSMQSVEAALVQQREGDSRPLSEILAENARIEETAVNTAPIVQEQPKVQKKPGKSESPISASNIRVQVEQLDKLMNLAGELVLARNQVLQSATSSQDAATIATAHKLNLITTELQERIMKVRMQPVGILWNKFPRVVRDLSKQLGKKITLKMKGKSTELDKTLIEAIKDPLTHLVRNAVDHGVEMPEVREAAGKDREGTLLLHAYHESGQVNMEIIDDGAGIDAAVLKAKAVKNGLISQQESDKMTDRQAYSLIFHAGLSTAKAVTNVSGRGVGMDVVKTNIEQIGGTVEVNSTPGRGTTVRIRIPLTLAIVPALIVTTAQDRYAIPQVSLVELVRLDGSAAKTGIENLHGSPVYRLRGELLPLLFLDDQLGVKACDEANEDSEVTRNIVVVRAADQFFGLVVDDVNDTEEIVVKPLDQQTKNVPVYAGSTILGDGQVALILDVLGLARRAGVLSEEGPAGPLDVSNEEDVSSKNSMTFLLLRGHGDRRMAIELSDVDRLEEIQQSSIENSGGCEVIQYRGEIMPLIRVSDCLGMAASDESEQDAVPVVVHSHKGRRVGLIVNAITDIAETVDPVVRPSSSPGITRSVVIDGRVTDQLDLDYFIESAALEAQDEITTNEEQSEEETTAGSHQFCTFYLDDLCFGVDVTQVQEVLRPQPMTRVPLTNSVVRGLINLRGQTVTALDMRRRLGLQPNDEVGSEEHEEPQAMNLVLRTQEGIVSILVDRIGEVLTIGDSALGQLPNTMEPGVRSLLADVYQLPESLLLTLDIEQLVAVDEAV